MQNDVKIFATIDNQEAITSLSSNISGLTSQEANKRLLQNGYNVFKEKSERSIIVEFLSHFKSPLILILLCATIISAIMGEVIDSIIIFVIILLSVILDFVEEHSAGKAAKKLSERIKTTATVYRDGCEHEIKITDICQGDVIYLNAGDLVPADARILSAKDFYVNQSALTGESYPCHKNERIIEKNNLSISDLNNIVFTGTNVVSGTATVIVVAIGRDTEFGKIAVDLAATESPSEFEVGVTRFGFFIMKVILFIVIFIFLINSLVNHQILESFMFAIAIAVGVTPELLPVIMSVTMARGSLKMSHKGVIVKRLAAIPNFGGMDVLCTDKTGTLTEDNIQLVTYTDINKKSNEQVLLYAYLNSFHQTGVKNPLDTAVLNFKKITINSYKKIDEIPFDFNRKIMSVVVNSEKERIIVSKGAPEEIFKRCKKVFTENKTTDFNSEIKTKALEQYHGLSADGCRVLGLAIKKIDTSKTKYDLEDECDLTLLGFISFLDPPKAGVSEVLKKLAINGVEVKVITGDNELVAKKICQDVGLSIKGILQGKEISQLTDDALQVRAEKTTIFARFSPDEKNRIISALRHHGHVVGYLGDGINDAPSIKNADVGISVSNAVDVARESADIVLTEKSLRVLQDGMLEGRKTFGNTMKYIMMGLSSNFGNMFSVIAAVFFLPFLPMLPIQILLNNFIYDFSQLTLPSDNIDKDWIQKPRRWNLKFVKKFMLFFGPISSFYDIMTFIVLFYIFHASAGAFQTGWFIESLATQTLVIHVIRTRHLPFIKSRASKYLIYSTIACVAIGWIIPYTIIGKYFKFEPLSFAIILSIIGIVILYLITVEIMKHVFYKKYDFNTIK